MKLDIEVSGPTLVKSFFISFLIMTTVDVLVWHGLIPHYLNISLPGWLNYAANTVIMAGSFFLLIRDDISFRQS